MEDLLEFLGYAFELLIDVSCSDSYISDGWDLEFDIEKVNPMEANYGDNVYKNLKMLFKKGFISKDVYDKLYKNQKDIDKTNDKIKKLQKKSEIPYFELRQIMDELQVEIDNLYHYGRMDYEKHQQICDKIQTGLAEIARFEKEYPGKYYLKK